jgi:hypothetical protein
LEVFLLRYNCVPVRGSVDCADVDWMTTGDVEEGMDDVEGRCGDGGEVEDVDGGTDDVDGGTNNVDGGEAEDVDGWT